MATVNHSQASGIHPGAYWQIADPGAVGAGIMWVDKSAGPPYTLKLRNTGNTGWDVVGGTSGGAASTFDVLGANVVAGTAGTFVDILTRSLPAGTYLVRAHVTASSSGGNNITIRLTDGTTTYASTEQIPVGANYPVNLAIEMRVVLAATTTVHLTGCASGGTATFYASTAGTVSAGATQLITQQSA